MKPTIMTDHKYIMPSLRIVMTLRIQELTENLIKKQATLDTVTAEKTSLLYKIETLQVGVMREGVLYLIIFNSMGLCYVVMLYLE